MHIQNRRNFSLAVASVLGTASLPALAQSGKITRLVVGFSAGNPFDSLARVLAERLRVLLDSTVIVENKPGASGTIAADFVRNGPSDGSVIWLSPFGTMVTEPIVNKAVVRFDPVNDFIPVAEVATFDIALAVGPAAPAKTLSEYMAMVKADPSKGSFGTPGANNLPHFFTNRLEKEAKIDMTNVPFKSAGEAMTSAMGGQTAAIASGFGDLIQMHRAGRIRILATSGAKRTPFAPEIPTFREAGYPIEGQGWFGIFLHKSTPRDVVRRVNKAVAEALKSKELVDFMQTGGLNPAFTTPEEFADILKRDIKVWGDAIRASGIKFE